MTDISKHPAVVANLNSVKYAMAKDRDNWLAQFADDAHVCDPVGKSLLDPEGNGHCGKAEIGEFYDNVIRFAATTMTIGEHRVADDFACAVPMQAITDLGDGVKLVVDMITVYEVNQQGLIKSLRAYWDFAGLQQQLVEVLADKA